MDVPCVQKDFRIDLAGSSTGGIVTRVGYRCEWPEGLNSSATCSNTNLLTGGEDFGGEGSMTTWQILNSEPLARIPVYSTCDTGRWQADARSATPRLLREVCLILDVSDPESHADMPAGSF